jgi:hypothetical protein
VILEGKPARLNDLLPQFQHLQNLRNIVRANKWTTA